MNEVIPRRGLGEKWEQFLLRQIEPAHSEPYWKFGERLVDEELLPMLQRFNVNRETALELGCGIGRLFIPMSRFFRKMVGVDISDGAIRRIAGFARRRGITNARFVTIRDPAELLTAVPVVAGQLSFLYCFQVFPHIQDFTITETYLKAVTQLLMSDGIAYLSFDTRRQTPTYHAKTAMPDLLLPRCWRRGMRRIRREPSQIEGALAECGLLILEQLGRNTSDHRYVVCPK